MGTIGLRFSAWQCHLVLAAVLILFGSARSGAGGVPVAQTDFLLTGASIPGVGVPELLVGLGPVTPPPDWTGTVQTFTNPFTVSLDTGNTTGPHFVHFGLDLLNNGVTTPVPLDAGSFPPPPTPAEQPDGQFIASFTAGNGLFRVHFDLTAPGGIVPQDFTYPANLPGFPNALEFKFTQGAPGVDPMITGQLFGPGPNGPAIVLDQSQVRQAPEPAALGLFGLGLVGVIGGSWRRWRLRKPYWHPNDRRAA